MVWTLLTNSTGNNNIAVGYQALCYNTSGNFNDAVGYLVLTAAGFRANLAVMCGLWSNERRSGNGGSVVRTADRRPRQAVRDVVAGIV